MRPIKNDGSSFESFLVRENILVEVDEAAIKRVLAWQIEHEMAVHDLGKPEGVA